MRALIHRFLCWLPIGIAGLFWALDTKFPIRFDPWIDAGLVMIQHWQAWTFGVPTVIAYLGAIVWTRAERIVPKHAKASGDLPLAFVVRYLGHHAKWGDSPHLRMEPRWTTEAAREIGRNLADGRLQAWGTWKPTHGAGDMQRHEIDRTEWLTLVWSAKAMAEEGTMRSHAFRQPNAPNGGVFSEIMVDHNQVETIWPRRGIIARLIKKSLAQKSGELIQWRERNAYLLKGNEHVWK